MEEKKREKTKRVGGWTRYKWKTFYESIRLLTQPQQRKNNMGGK